MCQGRNYPITLLYILFKCISLIDFCLFIQCKINLHGLSTICQSGVILSRKENNATFVFVKSQGLNLFYCADRKTTSFQNVRNRYYSLI